MLILGESFEPRRRTAGTMVTSLAIVIALGLVFFGYTSLRAWRVALTIDEAHTYYDYIQKGIFNVFNIDAANNHILNSLFTWCVTRIAGTSEFVLRLPNLFGHILFLIFSFRLLKRYVPDIVAVSGFVILNANPYILEFFSLCRGYGLSLGLLMPALYYFLRFMDETRGGSLRAGRSLSAALLFAGAAVLANLTLLIVFLGIVFLSFLTFAVNNARTPRGDGEWKGAARRDRLNPAVAIGLSALILLINGRNLLRYTYSSERLFADVAVAIPDLTDQDRESVLVVREGLDGQALGIPLAGAEWRFDRPLYFTGLRIKIPAAAWTKTTALSIRIGPQTFVFNGSALKALASGPAQDPVTLPIPENISLPRSRFSVLRNVINWNGDKSFFFQLGVETLVVGGLWALLWIGLWGIGRFGFRFHFVTPRQYRPLAVAVWILAALVAVPIYLLERSGELYWGGKAGFLRDTWLGLVQAYFHGKTYLSGEKMIVFWAAAGLSVLFLVLTLTRRRERWSASASPALALLALILFSTGFCLEEHAVLGLPYLLGRTAIFFAPLAGLFLILALASVRTNPRLRILATMALMAVALGAAAHFSLAANTSFVWEWKSDADNKTLVEDLRSLRDKIPGSGASVGLGIQWESYPGLRYYVERNSLRWLTLRVVPPPEGCDLYYITDMFDENRMVLWKRYPLSAHILVTPKNSPGSGDF
jgi:hypothetical protein